MKKVVLCVLCLFPILGPRALPQEGEKAPYKDPNAAIPDRVRDLMGRMTVEEKVAQLESGWDLPAIGSFKFPSVFDQDHIDEAMAKKMAGNGLGTYVLLGDFMQSGKLSSPREGAHRRNLLQSWIMKNTRLGIPILFHGEALHGAVTPGATSFPEAVGS